jgi:hypothetical protein
VRSRRIRAQREPLRAAFDVIAKGGLLMIDHRNDLDASPSRGA